MFFLKRLLDHVMRGLDVITAITEKWLLLL